MSDNSNIVSERVVQLLSSYDNCVQFLPIDIIHKETKEVYKAYVMNVMLDDSVLDREKSDMDTWQENGVDFESVCIYKLHLAKASKPIFRVARTDVFFFNEEIKNIIEKNNLTGLAIYKKQ